MTFIDGYSRIRKCNGNVNAFEILISYGTEKGKKYFLNPDIGIPNFFEKSPLYFCLRVTWNR